MNWLSQMIQTPIDLRKQYPSSYDTRAQPNGLVVMKEYNAVRGRIARGMILDALGNERLSSTELLTKIKKRNGGAFKRMLEIMVDEGSIAGEKIGQRCFWWRVK